MNKLELPETYRLPLDLAAGLCYIYGIKKKGGTSMKRNIKQDSREPVADCKGNIAAAITDRTEFAENMGAAFK